MRQKTKILLSVFIIFCLYLLSNIYGNFTVATAKENAVPPQEIQVTRQSSHCLRIQWKQVEGVSSCVAYPFDGLRAAMSFFAINYCRIRYSVSLSIISNIMRATSGSNCVPMPVSICSLTTACGRTSR